MEKCVLCVGKQMNVFFFVPSFQKKKVPLSLDSIECRSIAREALQRGDVEAAVEVINDLDPEVLDNNSDMHFHLQRQMLIEMIRKGKLEEALQFAQEELAPRAAQNVNISHATI